MTAKPFFLVFAALLLTVSLSSFIVRRAVAAGYTDVTVSEAAVMIDTRALVLLDVRNQSEYDAGHIRNAKLIPLWELAARLNELNKTAEILVYCGVGGRSINASQILASDGFSHVYNMLGGTAEWVREGFPVYIKYPSVQEAINNASAGETIHVSAGLYTEQLTVDKSLVLEGENRYTTIINATADDTVRVNADNVSISDFTLQYRGGCACFGRSVVNVTGCRDASVTNNVIVSDDYGIRVGNARKLTVAYNSVTCPGNTFIVVLNSSEVLLLENSIMAADGMELDNCFESVFSDNSIFSVRGAAVFAYQSNQNTFSGNEIIANDSNAVSISNCYNNTFLGNNISSNGQGGLFFWQSHDNSFFHNNFLGNGGQLTAYGSSSAFWDNGFEGNFWSSYTGADADLDGVGDTPKILDSTNRDNFPLKGLFHRFNTALDYDVDIVSDSAISELEYVEPDRTIRLQVSNTTANQTVGFCRMSIPHSLIDPYNDSISVVIDDGLTPVLFLNNTLYDNGTHRWIYFTYIHSTHEILIVPEFPTFLIPILFMVTMVATVATHRRRRSARRLKNGSSAI
jgi:parallel beta-helix repeat protein